MNTQQSEYLFHRIGCIFILLSISSFLSAQVNWRGGTSDWEDAANWDPALPVDGDLVIIDRAYYGLNNDPVISVPSSFSPNDIQILNGGLLTIQADLTVGAELKISEASVLDLTAGTVAVGGDIILEGLEYGDNPTMNISGGDITVTDDFIIDGSCVVCAAGGSPDQELSYGNINITGGTLSVADDLYDQGSSDVRIMINSGILNFGSDCLIPGQYSLFSNEGGTVNFSNTGTFQFGGNMDGTSGGSAGSINFNGITTLRSGDGDSKFLFYDLIINPARTLIQHAANPLQIYIMHDWTSTGATAYTHNNNSVTFQGTTAAQTITGTTRFYDVIIANGFGTIPQIILANNMGVSNSLTMTSGVINLQTNTLTLGTSGVNIGTLVHGGTSASGWMYGTTASPGSFKRWYALATVADGNLAGFFPMGNSANFRPLYFYFPTETPNVAGTVNVFHYDPGTGPTIVSFADGASTVVRRTDIYWNLTVDDGFDHTDGDPRVRIEGTNMGTVGNVNDLRVTLSGSVLGLPGVNGGTTSNPIVRRTNLDQLTSGDSPTFYIGSVDAASSPLPVELLNFNVYQVNEAVALEWCTASETNNNLFIIEKTKDGSTYEEVARLDGNGTTSVKHDYNLMDVKPYSGLSYYRLKQIDFDGTITYSKLVAINASDENAMSIILFPNPTVGEKISLNITNKEIGLLKMDIYDIQGRKMISIPLENMEHAGSKNFDILLPNPLPPGIYLAEFVLGNHMSKQKLVVR